MKLPGYIEIYVRLDKEGDTKAKELTQMIVKYGVDKVDEVENKKIKGEYVKIKGRGLRTNPTYFVGVHLDTGKEVVEMVA